MTSKPRHTLQSMLQESCQGHADFKVEILEKIRSFSKITLRGAGSRGSEVYRLLWESIGIEKEKMAYWDLQIKNLAQCKGRPVFPLFEGNFNPETTLVVHCVGSALPYNAETYASQGYINSLDGNLLVTLYEKFYCRYYKGIGRDRRLCQPNSRCSFFACEQIKPDAWKICPHNLSSDKNTLIIDDLGLHVNSLCTLKCKNCCEYINHYPANEKFNFPLARIKRDIDLISETCDFIRELCLQGGEFMLHPDSAKIIEYALSKPKIGIVSVTSNGVSKLAPADLDAMSHERFVLRISDYTDCLNAKQNKLFAENIAKLTAKGICYLCNRLTWITPSSMKNLGHSEARKRENHLHCFGERIMRCRPVRLGVYYPCQRARELTVHHIVDYPDNYLVLDAIPSRKERKDKIIHLNEREFYPSCAHCDWTLPIVTPGEQGFEPAYQYFGPLLQKNFKTL
jgi:hypothetical protein